VIVFVIGLALVLTEFFLVPGTIIPGLVGTLLMLGAIVFAMVDQWPADGGNWTLPSSEQLERPMFNLLLAITGAGVAVALLAKFLPKTSLYGRLVLSNAVAAGPGVTIPVVNMAVKAGDTGKAVTTLRPAGKAEIGGETHDVVTIGDFITAGASVRVVSVDGMRIVVELTGAS
jgi:membrane-bound serine protease (ClpP class)